MSGYSFPDDLPKSSAQEVLEEYIAELDKGTVNPKTGASKRKMKEAEKEERKRKITLVFPIPEDFAYGAEEFVISDKYRISKEHMKALWEYPPGKHSDSMFVKTTAVNVFGSQGLLEAGCVTGKKTGGVERVGLDKVALEAIRVLLILRVKREKCPVAWDTKRTLQTTVNTYIGDKIRTLAAAMAKKMMTSKQQKEDKGAKDTSAEAEKEGDPTLEP